MTSHQAQVPAIARQYFGADCTSYRDHPLIVQKFVPGKGWRRESGRQRVSGNKIRQLRASGVTSVALQCFGRTADFTIAELLKRDTRLLLGGSLIGSRTR